MNKKINEYNEHKYKEALQTIWDSHFEELEEYKTNPKSYPDYHQEWMSFLEARTKKIISIGGSSSSYDYNTAFKVYWESRIENVMNKIWEKRKEVLMKDFCDERRENKSPTLREGRLSSTVIQNSSKIKNASNYLPTTSSSSISGLASFLLKSSTTDADFDTMHSHFSSPKLVPLIDLSPPQRPRRCSASSFSSERSCYSSHSRKSKCRSSLRRTKSKSRSRRRYHSRSRKHKWSRSGSRSSRHRPHSRKHHKSHSRRLRSRSPSFTSVSSPESSSSYSRRKRRRRRSRSRTKSRSSSRVSAASFARANRSRTETSVFASLSPRRSSSKSTSSRLKKRGTPTGDVDLEKENLDELEAHQRKLKMELGLFLNEKECDIALNGVNQQEEEEEQKTRFQIPLEDIMENINISLSSTIKYNCLSPKRNKEKSIATARNPEDVYDLIVKIMTRINPLKRELGILQPIVDCIVQKLKRKVLENDENDLFTSDFILGFKLIQDQLRINDCCRSHLTKDNESNVIELIDKVLKSSMTSLQESDFPEVLFGLDLGKVAQCIAKAPNSDSAKRFIGCTLSFEGLSHVTPAVVDEIYEAAIRKYETLQCIDIARGEAARQRP